MTLVAFVRHAETDWNRAKRIQGHTDIPLNAAGRASLDGRTLPGELREMQCCTSPLLRCRETARLLGFPDARIEPGLTEMRWGDWEGSRLADLRTELGTAMTENESRGLDFRPPGGESPREVAARVRDWLAGLTAPTLAVTHRGVIRAVMSIACDWDMRSKPPVRLDWGAFHLFRTDSSGHPSPVTLNLR
jgi:broad specificity phosphatase PhoE